MTKQLITFFLCKAAGTTVIWILYFIGLLGFCFPYVCDQARAVSMGKGWRPVPEYRPASRVLVSSEVLQANYHGEELLKATLEAGATVVIVEGQPSHKVKVRLAQFGLGLSHNITVLPVPHHYIWLRDFGPILLENTQTAKSQTIFADLSYVLSESGRRVHDDFPVNLGRQLGVVTRSAALSLDGGNFLASDDACIASEPEQTSKRQGLVDGMKQFLGCDRVQLIRDPPHPHVDMYLKILPADVALVPEITQNTRDLFKKSPFMSDNSDSPLPLELQDLGRKLDGVALQLSKDFHVARLPMPLPYRGIFRSFTNSVLINQTALVPRFEKFGWGSEDYPDSDLRKSYEAAVTKVYNQFGFQVKFINSDALIYNGGSFHCIMLQLPNGMDVR